MNNKGRKTSHIVNIVQYDANGHVVLPATLTVGENPHSSDNTNKIPSTSWVRTYVTGLGYQSVLTLTTTGSSGAATLVSNTLNVPTYTLSGLGGEPAITAGTTSQYWRGDKSWQTLNTTAVAEGTNLYYTDARVNTYLTTNNYATQSYVGTQIANLVDSSPATLDTLNELAAALGDDPNFATTVTTSIGTKVPQTRTITINGTSYDLSANRSWTINSMVYPSAGIALSTGTAWGTSITDNSANWNTAYGWGNHASAGYLTSATAATTYVSLTGSYANPSWITSLAYSKITGVPAFLTSYTETDPYRVTAVSVSGTSTKTITLTRADASTVTTTWTDYDTDTNTYVTSAAFSGGTLTLTRNDSGTVSVSLDGRYLQSYTETDTLATVTGRGATTSTASSFTGGANITGLTVAKSGTDSTITFPAQTNDPGYIKHYESANTAIMYFNVSDDANDFFHFGYTGNPDAFKLRSDGVITVGTWQGSAIADSYISSAATWNAKQNALSGTGFVKISGSTISYDNSTYYLASNPSGYITSSSLSDYLPLTGGSLSGVLTTNAQLAVNDNIVIYGNNKQIQWNAAASADLFISAIPGTRTIEIRNGNAASPNYAACGLITGYATFTSNITVQGNLTVSSSNATGGGIILADDGDIVDLNDAYLSLRFSAGVRVFSANRSGSAVITLSNTGAITATGNITGANLSGTNTGDQTTITGNAGSATLLKSINTTSSILSNWNPQSLTYQAWGQAWAHSSISADTGDLALWLRASQYSAGGTEVCMIIDGDYYAGSGAQKVLHAGNYSSYALPLSGGTVSGATTFSSNVNANGTYFNVAGYIDLTGTLYLRGNANYLNAASNGWNTFLARNGEGFDGYFSRVFSSGHISSTGGNLHTNRGRVAFSSTAGDANHSIYNNYNNIDGEGVWDGMKMNVYNGLDVRTGAYNASTTVLQVRPAGISVNSLKVGFRNGGLTEFIQGEAWTTGFYGYNSNDGFLFYQRDTADAAHPCFHIGAWNNAGYGGWSNADSMITLVRGDGTKTEGQTYAGRGLSNSSYYSNIVKTTTKTIFRDIQGLHEFSGRVDIAAGSGGASGQNTVVGLQVRGLNGYASLDLGTENDYVGVIRSYGNDLRYYAGHWRTVGTGASEDHSHSWYTSRNGSSDWSSAKMVLNHLGNLTVSGGATLGCGVSTGRGSYGPGTLNLVLTSSSTGSDGICGIDFRSGNNYPSDGASIYFENSQTGSGEVARLVLRVENDYNDSILIRAGYHVYNSRTVDMAAQGNDNPVFRWQHLDNNRMGLDSSGNLTCSGDITAYGSPSDARLKTIKEVIQNPLEKVMSLGGYRFDWNEVNEMTNIKEDVGVIAQEVAEVLPELARTNDNGYMSVRYQGLTALLIEAVKEQQKQIEELKTKLDGLTK